MRDPRTALVILNWNGKHLLERFLPGIIKHTPQEVEIVIADNASSDDSVRYLKETFPGVRLILLTENHGFTGGYNRALTKLDADIFILLNSDMEVSPLWVEPCIELLKKDPGIAAVQPKIRSLDKRDFFEYAGAAGGFLDIMGYPFCRGRIFNSLEKDTGQYDDVKEIFWATGAALFIRADAFRKASGFDESFFAHMEEVELCWRLQNMGYKIMFCHQSVVYHLGGGSLPKTNPRKTYYNFRNSLWMLAKQLPSKTFYACILPRLLLDAAAALIFLLQGKPRDCIAVLKAHAALFKNIRNLRKENGDKKRRIPKTIYKGSILFCHYVRRMKLFSEIKKYRFNTKTINISSKS